MNRYALVQQRQDKIIKIAHRKRRYLSEWERKQVKIWRDTKGELPEQQLFFMIEIEHKLIKLGYMCNEYQDEFFKVYKKYPRIHKRSRRR